MERCIGYTRGSTAARTAIADRLAGDGATRVFGDDEDAAAPRPGWTACRSALMPGDQLIISTFGDLAATTSAATRMLAELIGRGVRVRTIDAPIIDTTADGGVGAAVVLALASLDRTTHRDRTRVGVIGSRSAGRPIGRPSVMTPERTAEALRLLATGVSRARIARALGVSAASVGRALARAGGSGDVEPGHRSERVFYRDHKPYAVPASFDDLVGADHGRMDLPHHVHWGPRRSADLGRPSEAIAAYEAVLQEAGVADQQRLLHPRLLRTLWPDLVLPARVRFLWESRFPELRSPDAA